MTEDRELELLRKIEALVLERERLREALNEALHAMAAAEYPTDMRAAYIRQDYADVVPAE